LVYIYLNPFLLTHSSINVLLSKANKLIYVGFNVAVASNRAGLAINTRMIKAEKFVLLHIHFHIRIGFGGPNLYILSTTTSGTTFFFGANNGGNYYHGFLIEGLTNARANQNSWVMEGFWNSGPVKRHLPKFWYLAVSVGSYLQPSGLDYWGETTVFILGWGKSTQGSFGFLVLLFRFYV